MLHLLNPQHSLLKRILEKYDQVKGNILAGIGFATDGGDTHIHLDPIREGMIDLCDLRLRIEFGGSLASIKLPEPSDLREPFILKLGGVSAWWSVFAVSNSL